MKNRLVLFAFLFVFTDLLFCQNDFFPLAPGNYFTYQYQHYVDEWYSAQLLKVTTDSGSVKYEIIDSTWNDSVITWQVKETYNIRHRIKDYFNNTDTSIIVASEGILPLNESRTLNHPIFFAPHYYIWFSGVGDGDTIFRYSSEESVHLIYHSNQVAGYWDFDSIVYYKNQGLKYVKCFSERMGNSHDKDEWDAVLIDSHITGLNTEGDRTTINNYALMQNYPNPFNPNTTISYQLPKSGQVTIKVYDVLGNEVKTLVNEYKTAGSYLVNFDAGRLSSGMYIYKITAGGFTSAKKMTLIK
jgi:hypothetical protein